MCNKNINVIVAGQLCLDIIPGFGKHQADLNDLLVPGKLNIVGPAAVSTGGAVSNTGIALHRLGITAHLMGKVGNDPLSKAVLKIVNDEGPALTDNMIIAEDQHTSYTIVINLPGIDRMFLHNPEINDTYVASDVKFDKITNAKLLHFGYPPLMRRMHENNGEQLIMLFQNAKERGLATSLDMAYVDPKGDAAEVDWLLLLRNVLSHVDFFLPSMEEILFMLDNELLGRMRREAGAGGILRLVDGKLLEEVSGTLLEMGAAVVVLKLGDRGLYLRTTNNRKRLNKLAACFSDENDLKPWLGRELIAPCFEVEVAGATGAGDSAIAGFLAGFLYGQSPEKTITSAAMVGACNVQQPDALSGIPGWEEVQKRIDDGWKRIPVDLNLPGWKMYNGHELWGGPNDKKY